MNYTLRNLAIAGMLAMVGLVLTSSYIKGQKAQLAKGKQEVDVLIAKKDIPAGTPASALKEGGYVEVTQVLREDQAPQALHTLGDVKKLSLSVTVYRGEQLTAHKFETKSGLNPAEQIKGTERLMALPVTPAGEVGKLVRPGDHVDMLASNKVKDARGNEYDYTWVVARDVVVLQTPESLKPQTEEAAPPTEVKAKADPEIYILQMSDKVARDIAFSHAFSNDDKIIFMLRPSEGDQETKLPSRYNGPDNT